MDCSLSAPAVPSDDADEPQTPARSPSRLDFCLPDLEEDRSLESYDMDWVCTAFRDDCPYQFVEENTFADDIATPDGPRLLLAEGSEDDPPPATELPSPESIDTSDAFPVTVVIQPQAPLPVRPLTGFQLDSDHAPPSRIAPQRLNYPHHGFSRSALLQQKTFWNLRHEEWQSRMEHGEGKNPDSETDNAYTGLTTARPCVVESPPAYMRIPPSGLERDLADRQPRRREQDVHASIFPRVGDISALRDPYSVNIDRCFFKYPLWTLHKMLYILNMDQRAAPSAPVHHMASVEASMSSLTLNSYDSSAWGDDEESDSTLVVSPILPNRTPLEPLKGTSSPGTPSWNHLCRWEFSWYARWELLINLFQRDDAKRGALEITMKSVAPPKIVAAPPSPPGRIFRFTIGGNDNDEDDEDDEDYGTLVSHLTFGVDFDEGDSDEECERALAFFNRKSMYSEMDL